MKNDRIYIDVECYKDYFLLSALQESTGKIKDFEIYPETEERGKIHKAIFTIMSKYQTISFNGNNYDLVMILAACTGYHNQALKNLSDKIILSKKPIWMICQDVNLEIPSAWDHIDIINVAPGIASLKIYGGRLGFHTIQDLPIDPSASIGPELRDIMRLYCHNDLYTTQALCNYLKPQIELREQMSEQYNTDLRSKGDAQIAETILKLEVGKITGKTYKKPILPDNYSFFYKDPQIVGFETPELHFMFRRLLNTEFTLLKSGSVAMPLWLKSEKIKIGNAEYQMGIGGLHSCEKSQYVEPSKDELLFELDVTSYYPNIILQQGIAPQTMGKPFLKVYQNILDDRIKAKKSGDNITAETLKIVVNGSFGKLGSKYSTLYSPELLIQTTITGQLALLMLIEKMHLAGIKTVSANTDGIVLLCPKSKENLCENIAFWWSLETTFNLERTNYKALASRDVNNYIAVTTKEKIKGKGVFAKPGLAKNPDTKIVFESVAKFVVDKTPIKTTIKKCKDINKFVKVRQVTGGGVWRDEELGKAVRFYYSNSVGDDECLSYKKNGNKVPKSDKCRPMMTLSEELPKDIDYKRYIDDAKKILKEIGL